MRFLLLAAVLGAHAGLARSSGERWEIARLDGEPVLMPVVNLGHPDDGGNETTSALKWLELGGDGIDTAYVYRNQQEVGEAFRRSGRARDGVFITTKIPCPPHANSSQPVTPEMAVAAVEEDLRELGMDYADLMLLHWPCKTGRVEDTQAAWLGLQRALQKKLVRAIGVSNFQPADLDAVLALGGEGPAVNQCQMSVGSHDDVQRQYTQQHRITYQAYSPLRHVQFSNPVLSGVARAHGVTVAQVALRWVMQQGVLLATSPGQSEEFMRADLDLTSFTLTEHEMASLSALTRAVAR